MIDPDDPIEEVLARSPDRVERFGLWLEHLLADRTAFAEASPLHPQDMSEWQSAVYLLTGCDQVRAAVGGARQPLDRAGDPLQEPRGAWSSSEEAVIEWGWAVWDVDRHAP